MKILEMLYSVIIDVDTYFSGLWRSDCGLLRCIEKFQCCKMTTEAEFSIVVKDMKKGYTKKCTMKVYLKLTGLK